MNVRRKSSGGMALAALVLGAALPRAALADPSVASMAMAETLFREGKALLTEKNYEAACPKLMESQRLDPGTGTLLTLALCHEGQGKIATASAEFHDALDQARVSGRQDRIAMASEHLALLEPTLSRLVIRGERGATTRIVRDGEVIGEAALDSAVPIDPGEHVIEASAPNKQTWTRRITVTREPQVFEIQVPPLAANVAEADAPAIVDHAVEPGTSSKRIAAYVIGGTGVATALVGGIFGIQAISKSHDAKGRCPGGLCDDVSALAENDDAKIDATRSNILVGTGAALFVTSAVLFLTDAQPKAPGLSASVGPKGGSVRWTAQF